MSVLTHEQVVINMVVTDNSAGWATFTEASAVPDVLKTKDGTYRNVKLAKFPNGTKLRGVFRLGSGTAHLVSVTQLSNEESVPSSKSNEGDESDFIDGIYFAPDAKAIFSAMDVLAQKGGVAKLLVTGPSGYGKSSMARAFARQTGRDFFRMDCALVRDTEEWFGYREAVEGSTVFKPTEFTKLAVNGNSVILLDEFNRIEPWISNSLFALLDDTRATTVHNEQIVLGDNVVFIATINQGYQYAGTFMLDGAMRNRMNATLEAHAVPANIEVKLLEDRYGLAKKQAVRIVEVMTRFRNDDAFAEESFDPSTRSSCNVAALVASGLGDRQAFEFVITNSATNRKSVIDVLNSILGTLAF